MQMVLEATGDEWYSEGETRRNASDKAEDRRGAAHLSSATTPLYKRRSWWCWLCHHGIGHAVPSNSLILYGRVI